MARRGQIVTRRKSVGTDRGGVIVKACEGALEQLESRQLLSAVGNLSTPTTLSSHVLHVAHLNHVNHVRHMAAMSKSGATMLKRSAVTVSSPAAVAASTPVAAATPPAFTVIQPSADNSNLAFEAENTYITDPESDGQTWQVKSGTAANGLATTASGGAALFANRPGTSNGLATYHLHFNAPGIYKLYARDKFVGGGDNSMLVPPGTAAAPGNISASPIPGQTYSNDAANPLADNRVYGDYTWDLTVNTATYNVTAAGDTTIALNMRENGYYVDRLVLSTNTALAAADLDALANTPQTLGAPQTLTAVMGGKSVQLNWQAVPTATSYKIGRSTVLGGPYTNIASNVTATTYNDNNLANGTYYYSVTAVNATGESLTASPEASATVTGALSAPANVRQTPGTDQVLLSWTPTLGATNYTIKRATAINGTYSAVTGGTGVTTTSFADTSVTPGTQYYYIITAGDGSSVSPNSTILPGATVSTNQGFSSAFYTSTNGANPRIYSSATSKFGYYTTVPQINFTGGGDDTAPPDAPPTWNPGTRKGDFFAAHWEGLFKVPFTDDYTFFAGSDDGIRVTVDGVILAPDNINADRGYVDDTHAPAVHLVAGQYADVEVDYNQGNGGWAATFGAKGVDPNNPNFTSETIVPQSVVYIPQPKVVAGITGTGNNGSIQLNWARGNVETDSYNIYSSATGLPGSFTLAGTSTSTSFSKSGFPSGSASYFMVTAVNGSGEGALSTPVAVTPAAGLLAPTNVTETPHTDGVVLNWTASLGATGYNVKRATTLNGPYTLVTGGAVAGTTFTDTTVTAGTQYYYVVTATDTGIESGNSTITPGKTFSPLAATQGWSSAFYYSNSGGNPRIWSSTASVFGYYTTTPVIDLRGGGVNTAPPNAPAGWNPNGNGNLFDAHWEGYIKVPFTDDYTLFAGSDDGIQVTVDGVTLTTANGQNHLNSDRGYVDDQQDQILHFTAGQYVKIEVDYNQGGGGWDATLKARGSDSTNPLGTTEADVPQSVVYIPQAKAVTNLSVAGKNGTAILNWTRSNVRTDNYNIYQSATGAPGTFTLSGTAPGTASGFSKTGLANGTTYYFMVTAVNTSGESLLSNVVTTTPVLAAPDTPLNPVARATIPVNTPKATPTVSWSAQLFTDTYNVYRSTSATGTFTLIKSGLTGTSYVDTDPTLAFGNTYFYKVSGTNTIGEGAQTAAVSAAYLSGGEIHAYNNQWWKSPTQNTNGFQNIGGPADYAEVRPTIDFDNPPVSTIGPINYSEVATGKIHVNVAGTYTFVNATDDDGYLFVDGKLVASEPGGHGVDNAFLGAVAGSNPFNPGTPVPLTLAVGDYDFIQFMSQGGGGSGIHLRMVDPANAANIIAVPANNATSPVTYSTSIVSSLPTAPINVQASPGGATDVSLNFNDTATSELHFLVQRSTSQNGPYTTVAVLGLHDNSDGSAISFNDPALQPATIYWYRVVGTNFDGVGTPSTPVSVTTGTTVAQGLEGHYYHNPNYSLPGAGTLLADDFRVDPQVNFQDGVGLPTGYTTNFSTRWTGKVLADTAGKYRFTLNTDDGSRLFIDGVKVVDSYFDKGQGDVTGPSVTLTAGYHDVVMEFYQIGGGYGARLEWNPADPSTGLPVSGGPVVIPSDHLQAIASVPATPTALTFPATGAKSVTVTFNDNAVSELGYTVERSTDPLFGAASTSTIAFIPFSTTAATGSISYTDKTVAPGQYYYRVQGVNYDGASNYVSGSVVVPAVATGGTINGVVATPATLIDLTAAGTLDWAHYGLTTTDGFNHKVGATLRISDATLIGNDYRRREGNPTSFQWSDGTPTLSANTNNTIDTNGLNNGFEITAPAGTTDRILTVYVGLVNAQGTLTATLSDGSAATFSDASIINLGGTSTAVYTITYHAGSANQQITVDWVNTQNAGGRVQLKAATLSQVGDLIAPTITRVQQVDSAVVVKFASNTTAQTGFEVQRSSDGVNFTSIGTAGPGATSFIDRATGLTQYATYTYRVRALGSPSNSAFGTAASTVYLPTVTPGQHANGFVGPTYPAVTLDGLPISGGFETPANGPATFTYNPGGGPWTFNGTSGILNPRSAFGELNAPEGSQVAFLQNNSGDSRNDADNGQYIGQTVTFTAGTYVFADIDAGRPANTQASYKVVLDQGTANEKTIFSNRPLGNDWTQHVSAPFTVTAGDHTLRLVATGPIGADNTSFIDAVRIVPQASYAPLATPFQDLQLNGNAAFQAPTSADTGAGYLGRLRLTPTAGGQTSSAFERVAVGSLTGGFTTTFDYQISNPGAPPADGAAFVIQSNGPTALGGGGGAYGYDGIGNSIAIYLNEYNNVTQTGIGINGARPDPALDMSAALGNGFNTFPQSVDGQTATDVYRVTITYDATAHVIHETVVDTTSNATYTHDYTGINLVSILGNSGAAYTGFTAATGGAQATHDVLNWTLAPTTAAPSVINSAAGTPIAVADGTAQRSEVRQFTMTFDRAVILGPGSVTAVRLNTGGSGLDNGSAPTDVSAALGTPVSNDGGFTWIIPVLPGVAGLTDATGSLSDGIYTLTAHASGASGITDTANHALASGDVVQTTHRLFGDANGNKTINNADYGPFRNAFGSSVGQTAYVSYFDFDNNGVINNADYGQFRNRFGKTFAY
jgi:fibronectin type 3 domain-containing protein